jgi:predicted metalloprotease with PDZ domain
LRLDVGAAPPAAAAPARYRLSLEVAEAGPLGLNLEDTEGAGSLTVRGVAAGGLGERAGVRAGDRLVALRGASTLGWTMDDYAAQFMGPRPLALDLEREA